MFPNVSTDVPKLEPLQWLTIVVRKKVGFDFVTLLVASVAPTLGF